jgi:hypothetical protein
MERDDNDILMIFFIVLFFSVMSYLSGFYISKAHSAKIEIIKVIENMIDKIGTAPTLEPLTENEFNELQALIRVRKMLDKQKL